MANPTPEQIAAQLWHLALSSTGNEFIDAAEAAIYAAIHTAELAQAERDAALCERMPGPHIGIIYTRAIRKAVHDPLPAPGP